MVSKSLISSIALSLLLPPPAFAQQLTPSEQAAKSQRAATAAEHSIKKQECQLNPVPDTSVEPMTLSSKYKGRAVFLSPIRMLRISSIVYEGHSKGTYAITKPLELPYGGIASFDFCEPMQLVETRKPQKRGDGLRHLGLRLRVNLDLEYDYPIAFEIIKQRRLVWSTPSSRYVEIEIGDFEEFDEWFRKNENQLSWLDKPFPVIVIEDRAFIPYK